MSRLAAKSAPALAGIPGVGPTPPGGPTLPAERAVVLNDAVANIVTPGFLQSTRIPLMAGRDFQWDEKAAVINQSLARRLYGETNPIGKTLLVAQCEEPLTVVGVAADSSNAIGPDFRSGNGTDPTVYLPLSSNVFDLPVRSATFLHVEAKVCANTARGSCGERAGSAKPIDSRSPLA